MVLVEGLDERFRFITMNHQVPSYKVMQIDAAKIKIGF